jgi:hypothetical protein
MAMHACVRTHTHSHTRSHARAAVLGGKRKTDVDAADQPAAKAATLQPPGERARCRMRACVRRRTPAKAQALIGRFMAAILRVRSGLSPGPPPTPAKAARPPGMYSAASSGQGEPVPRDLYADFGDDHERGSGEGE